MSSFKHLRIIYIEIHQDIFNMPLTLLIAYNFIFFKNNKFRQNQQQKKLYWQFYSNQYTFSFLPVMCCWKEQERANKTFYSEDRNAQCNDFVLK